ncbi:MAG TPA: hypothetical protein DCL43_08190 [Chitinophagaceae bacterium]|nr:hypothetical protein [Chitinophagaceae bacterium]HAN39860.1 hypothetical protein [Chitinophagaceae bacterium]
MKRLLRVLGVATLLPIMALLAMSCSKKSSGGTTGGPTPVPPIPPSTLDSTALRGVWITTAASNALDSRANIRQAVLNCKAANINNIFMVVYNNGRTIYPSPIMQNLIGVPIMERFAGRDPLQEIIEEARAHNIKVHAWFEYGFASSFSQNGGLILQAKPHWAARDVSGNLVVKNGFDWLNAFHPEVQDFMISLFKEVLQRYPTIDGLQGDDRLPAVPSTAGYDSYTVNLYRSENNGANPPSSFSETSWVNWRAKKLTGFLKRLRDEVKAIKPSVQLTMSPSVHPWALGEYLQDWPTWVDSSYVDAILPQCYRYDINSYTATLNQQKSFYRNPNVKFWPGVIVKSGNTLVSDAYLTQMIQANRTAGFKGECFFFYEGIKDKLTYFTVQYPNIR